MAGKRRGLFELNCDTIIYRINPMRSIYDTSADIFVLKLITHLISVYFGYYKLASAYADRAKISPRL